MIPSIIRYTREAVAAIYTIPRGKAAIVSEAIKALAKISRPLGVHELTIPNTYSLKVGNHFVLYEVVDNERIVKILTIERTEDGH